MRGRTQTDDLRADVDRPIVGVTGVMVEGCFDTHDAMLVKESPLGPWLWLPAAMLIKCDSSSAL
jgi:hypothetical protein